MIPLSNHFQLLSLSLSLSPLFPQTDQLSSLWTSFADCLSMFCSVLFTILVTALILPLVSPTWTLQVASQMSSGSLQSILQLASKTSNGLSFPDEQILNSLHWNLRNYYFSMWHLIFHQKWTFTFFPKCTFCLSTFISFLILFYASRLPFPHFLFTKSYFFIPKPKDASSVKPSITNPCQKKSPSPLTYIIYCLHLTLKIWDICV